MKDRLIALVFETHNGRIFREHNIGDKVLLSHSNDGYSLYDGHEFFGLQVTEPNSDIDISNLLNYVADKTNSKLIIWDKEYSRALDEQEVEIAAISQKYVIVVSKKGEEALLASQAAQDFSNILADALNDIVHPCECEEKCECKEEEKEETEMFSDLGVSFGKLYGDQFRLSINGLAVRNAEGKYVTFNPETRELVEVTTGFFDDMRDLLFVMPATELEVGDIILHQNKPYYISVAKDNVIKGIDFEDAIEATLVPKTNVFGMKYYTKVFNCLGTNNILGSDIASNPMMAYALMGGKDFDLSKVMMFQALSGQGKGIADFSENPIMLMALMGNEKGGDLSNFAKMQMLTQLSAKKKETKKSATKEN